jgi:hypothetical protein
LENEVHTSPSTVRPNKPTERKGRIRQEPGGLLDAVLLTNLKKLREGAIKDLINEEVGIQILVLNSSLSIFCQWQGDEFTRIK